MPYTLEPKDHRIGTPSFNELQGPLRNQLKTINKLESRGNRPLQMEFEHQLNALIFFHLEEHTSGRHLMQVLEQDQFAREQIAPPEGIKKSISLAGIPSASEIIFSALGDGRRRARERYCRLTCSDFASIFSDKPRICKASRTSPGLQLLFLLSLNIVDMPLYMTHMLRTCQYIFSLFFKKHSVRVCITQKY